MKEQRMIFDEDNLRNVAIEEIKTCISNLKGKIEEAQSALTISEDDWSGSSKDALASNIGAIKDTAMSQANALEDIITGINIAINEYAGWERNVENGLDGQTSDMCPIHLTPKINGVCPKCIPNNPESGIVPAPLNGNPNQLVLNLIDFFTQDTPDARTAAIVLGSTLDIDNNKYLGGERGIYGLLLTLGSNGILVGGENNSYKISLNDAANNDIFVKNAQNGLPYMLTGVDGNMHTEYNYAVATTGNNATLHLLDGTVIKPEKGKVYNAIRVNHYTKYTESEEKTKKVLLPYEILPDGTAKIIGVLYVDTLNGGTVNFK